MDKEFSNLFELQKIDKVIYDSEQELSKIPGEIKKQEHIFKAKEEEYNNIKDSLGNLKQMKEEKEQFVEEHKQMVVRKEEKLYALKTYQEFNETQKEIATAKKEIKETEDEIVKYMEQIEEQEKLFEKVEQDYNNLKKEFNEFIKQSGEKEKDFKKVISTNTTLRNKLVKNINAQLLSQYDLIRSRRQGVAIVKINSNTCSACFMNLPPQLVIEVRKKDKVVQCPSCQRILIWDDEQQ
jgi:predicted  nucleic acid-binding Zn-ribbon protein